MKRFICLIATLLIALASTGTLANETTGPQVKVLVVYPATPVPTKVYFATDGEFTRGMLIPFASIANNINLKKRSTELGAQLDAAIEGYDRYQIFHEALQKAFDQRYPVLSLTKTTNETSYLDKGKPNGKAADEGYAYVMVIEDLFTGLSMLNLLATRSDDVAPAMNIRYKLYDSKSKKELSKGTAAQNGMVKKHISLAPKDRDLFVAAYPDISRGISFLIMGNLLKTDLLHAMAATVGRGNDVPKVSVVLKNYEKRFSYKHQPLDGWRQVKMTTPYVQVIEPKSDMKFQMGIRYELDLLIPEFGQEFDSVDGYLGLMTERLADGGIDVATMAPFQEIALPDQHQVYSYSTNKDGGRNIVALRLVDKDIISIVTIVFTRDFDTLYPQYRSEIEKNIANTRLKITPR